MSYQRDRRGGRSKPYHRGGGQGGYSAGRRPWTAGLTPGLQGFLCTCNMREKDCLREAYNLLNEYADKMYGPEDWRAAATKDSAEDESKKEESTGGNAAVVNAAGSKGQDQEDEEEEEDIAKSLQREVQQLQAAANKPQTQRRFRQLPSGANNCVFINTTVADPVKMAHSILQDLKASQQPRSRFLLRLLPVEVTCSAKLEDISKAASPLFDKYFSEGNKTFAVIYKCRNNNQVNRQAVIEQLAELVSLKNASNHANLTQPQLAIVVEVIRAICCISVVPDYFGLAKYNLQEVAAPPKDKEKGKDQEEEEEEEDQEDSDEEDSGEDLDPELPDIPSEDLLAAVTELSMCEDEEEWMEENTEKDEAENTVCESEQGKIENMITDINMCKEKEESNQSKTRKDWSKCKQDTITQESFNSSDVSDSSITEDVSSDSDEEEEEDDEEEESQDTSTLVKKKEEVPWVENVSKIDDVLKTENDVKAVPTLQTNTLWDGAIKRGQEIALARDEALRKEPESKDEAACKESESEEVLKQEVSKGKEMPKSSLKDMAAVVTEMEKQMEEMMLSVLSIMNVVAELRKTQGKNQRNVQKSQQDLS